MKNKKAELLAPAGSYESFIGAVNAGADAVYIGGIKFGARANANNLEEEQLLKAIDMAHLHNRNLYLTINTLLKNKELELELYDYLKPLYEQGLEAVIVQDTGVLQFIRHHFPDLSVHASTQMTITGVEGAKIMEELGVTRVVTARELSLVEIHEIHRNTGLEIESFVHGALCYCYSGQCLYSSLLGGRSGNRGRCAQPCRLPYEVLSEKVRLNSPGEQFVLSPKDMCTIDILPQLIEAGVYSFKIEGRMKSPEYTAGVTSIYRKYIDLYLEQGIENYKVAEVDRRLLMDLYNRGSFTSGYYHQFNGRKMISLSKPNHFGVMVGTVTQKSKNKLTIKNTLPVNQGDVIENFTLKDSLSENQHFSISVKNEKDYKIGDKIFRTRNESLLNELHKNYIHSEIKENIKGYLILSQDLPAKLRIDFHNSFWDLSAAVSGSVVEKAISRPMTEETIKKQMLKTGNTPFAFKEFIVEMDSDIFISLQALNELRRAALCQLEEKILNTFKRESYKEEKSDLTDIFEEVNISFRNMVNTILNIYIEKEEYLKELLPFKEVTNIYIDSSLLLSDTAADRTIHFNKLEEYTVLCHQNSKGCYLVLPSVFRKDISSVFESQIEELLKSSIDGIIIKNFEEYGLLKKYHFNKPLILDHNMYTFNKESKKFWKELAIEYDTAPLELNYRELKERGCENSELIVYGYLPLMVSAQCVKKTTTGCNHKTEQLFLKDRYQKVFSVKNQCNFCYNTIYNSKPLVLLDNVKDINELKPRSLRMNFTIEPSDDIKKITKEYIDCFVNHKETSMKFSDFTRGHLKRGIE